LKPTYGLVPRTGIFPLAWSLDHAGPLAWTVEDCAILLQAMAGHDPLDPASVALPLPDYRGALSGTIKGLRIGLVRHFHEEDNPPLDPALKRAIDGAMGVFRGLGAEVREVRLPPLADWASCAMLVMMSEAWAVHEPWLKARPQDYGEIHRDRVTLGAFVSAADYLAAQRMRRELGQRFAEAMQEVDLLVAAVTPGEAPEIEAVTKWSSFERPSLTSPINLLGAPALALRCGFGESGLPLGMQIVGRPFEDALVLHAGHHYEKATQWAAKRPPLAGG
jgi:aspartyl-tRNA(Asn)/glutamyl-tRNA(Gln) amidotransferase subunit A